MCEADKPIDPKTSMEARKKSYSELEQELQKSKRVYTPKYGAMLYAYMDKMAESLTFE